MLLCTGIAEDGGKCVRLDGHGGPHQSPSQIPSKGSVYREHNSVDPTVYVDHIVTRIGSKYVETEFRFANDIRATRRVWPRKGWPHKMVKQDSAWSEPRRSKNVDPDLPAVAATKKAVERPQADVSLTLEYLDDTVARYGPTPDTQISISRQSYEHLGRPPRLSGVFYGESA